MPISSVTFNSSQFNSPVRKDRWFFRTKGELKLATGDPVALEIRSEYNAGKIVPEVAYFHGTTTHSKIKFDKNGNPIEVLSFRNDEMMNEKIEGAGTIDGDNLTVEYAHSNQSNEGVEESVMHSINDHLRWFHEVYPHVKDEIGADLN